MIRSSHRTALTIASGIALGVGALGSLAGCSTTEPAADSTATPTKTATSTASSTASSSATPSAAAASGAAAFQDGSYSATGTYTSPAGPEAIEVSATIADGVVTEVTVTGKATNPNSIRFQKEFSEGVSAQVVGKPLESVEVDTVAGSSLTGAGFNEAIAAIQEEARG